MRLTGERPIEGATPDALLALHDAGYREVVTRLGSGRVLDVGCGIGDETRRLLGPDRQVFGVDYDPATAAAARRHTGGAVNTAAMDGGHLGFADRSFRWVCSSHIIEHFTLPERHVAELARVCTDDGTVFVITPNRPADFENPFHVHLFEAPQLASLLRLFFIEVEVHGIEGDELLHADFATRRARGQRLLALDALGLRHRLPRRAYVWGYERVLPLVYRLIGSAAGVGSGIDASHLYLTHEITPATPALFALARRPRPPVGPGEG